VRLKLRAVEKMLNPNVAGKFDDLVTQLTREDPTALF
jgi:hypothetical protein